MTFQADYPGAIVVEAANYGYGNLKNHPVGFVYHTPEELADDDPQTPGYLARTTRNASYTYFVSYLGFVFQLVPESEGAYANYVNGKPYPFWANPNINLNRQGISISFEGYAATIHKTMARRKPQWNAGVALVAHRAEARSISPDNWARHMDVSVLRGDTGRLDVVTFTLDVKAKMQPPQPKPEPPEPEPPEEVEAMAMLIIKGNQKDEQSVFDPHTGRKRKFHEGPGFTAWEQREAARRTAEALGEDFVFEEIPQADYDRIPYDG